MLLACPVCKKEYEVSINQCKNCQWDGMPFKQQILLGKLHLLISKKERNRLKVHRQNYHVKIRQEKIRTDVNFWEESTQRNTALAYQNYIEQFPSGVFSIEAQQIIDLKPIMGKKSDGESIVEKDIVAWEKAQKNNTKGAYQIYIQQFPEGRFIKEAQSLLSLPTDKQPKTVESVVENQAITVAKRGKADFKEIQTAIDQSKEGDTILIKGGLYILTAPLKFRGRKNLNIIGERTGSQPVSIQYKEGFFDIGKNGLGDGQLRMQGITFVSLSKDSLVNHGKANLFWEDCEFRGGGLYFTNGYTEFNDCTFVNVNSGANIFLQVLSNAESVIKNCIFLVEGNANCEPLKILAGGYAYIEGSSFLMQDNSKSSVYLIHPNPKTTFENCTFNSTIYGREEGQFINCKFS